MVEAGCEGAGEVVEDAPALLSAGVDGGEQRLHKPAASGTLRSERQLAPDHRRAQGPFGRVVRRFDAVDLRERPQPVAVRVQFVAHAHQPCVGAEQAAQEQAFDLVTDRFEQTPESSSRECAVTTARPLPKQLCGRSQEVASQSVHLTIRVLESILEAAAVGADLPPRSGQTNRGPARRDLCQTGGGRAGSPPPPVRSGARLG